MVVSTAVLDVVGFHGLSVLSVVVVGCMVCRYSECLVSSAVESSMLYLLVLLIEQQLLSVLLLFVWLIAWLSVL